MTIKLLARATVKREHRKGFEEFVSEATAFVRENEDGTTLAYDFYLGDADEEDNCVIHEAYADAAALLQHLKNLAPHAAKYRQFVSIDQFQFFGPVPQTILDQFQRMAPVKVYPDFVGGV